MNAPTMNDDRDVERAAAVIAHAETLAAINSGDAYIIADALAEAGLLARYREARQQ